MFSLPSTNEHNTIIKQLLRDQLTMYQDREIFLHDYLTTFPRVRSTPAKTSAAMPTKLFKDELVSDHGNLQSLFTRLNLSTRHGDSLPPLKNVVGLESVKEVLQEAVILPEQFPDLFKTRRAWRTILLYGPPGVGKTYISKAIAAESKSTFFALTAGDLMSVSIDNCERVVKELFAAARRSGKVVLYCDDVDIFFSNQGGHQSECLRRVRGQLLKEFEGLQDYGDKVVFIGSSRTPWLLEEELLCRMDRRVYVGLPDAKRRTKMLKEMVGDMWHTLRTEDIENIATECETYSCSDMKALAMDAGMEPLRIIQESGYFRRIWVEQNGKRIEKMSPCRKDDDGAMEMRHTEVERSMLYIPAVTCLDFELALDTTKPTVGFETVEKHLDFTRRK